MAGYTMGQAKLPLSILLMRGGMRSLSLVAPSLAGRWGYKMFRTPRRKILPSHPIFERAVAHQVSFAGDQLSCYEWGEGETILLVHGWESGAEDMAHFVSPLVEQGFRVIAYDGPAHGQSEGTQADPIVFGAAAAAVAKSFGPIYGVISHSLGAAGTIIGVDENTVFNETQKLVLISSPDRLQDTVIMFGHIIGLGSRAFNHMVRIFSRQTGRGFDDYDISKIVQRIDKQGLIIHDERDMIAPFTAAESIHAAWDGSQLIGTKGFGHRRILKQGEVMNRILSFLDT